MPPRLTSSVPSVTARRRASGVLSVSSRGAVAASALAEGEALLASEALEQAGERFQAASRGFDEVGDARGSARSLLGLGRVLLGLQDASCREVLEDAGTAFEDLEDEAGVRVVDQLLRDAEAAFEEESPRSFHSVGLLRVTPPT